MEQDNSALIKDNIERIKEQVSETALKSGRSPEDITIVAVSKKFPAEYIKTAYENGMEHIGENRVDELLEKQAFLTETGINPKWHMVGSIQRKKVRKIIGKTHLIHSVDSISLLEEISSRSEKQGIITPVLIQVNVSGEEAKHGFNEEGLIEKTDEIFSFNGVRVSGLMTMAPFTDDEYILKNVFTKTKDLFDKMKGSSKSENFLALSMGMSNDFKIAIACGATHIRVGTSIFGQRKY